jgi:hypothetical protein
MRWRRGDQGLRLLLERGILRWMFSVVLADALEELQCIENRVGVVGAVEAKARQRRHVVRDCIWNHNVLR